MTQVTPSLLVLWVLPATHLRLHTPISGYQQSSELNNFRFFMAQGFRVQGIAALVQVSSHGEGHNKLPMCFCLLPGWRCLAVIHI